MVDLSFLERFTKGDTHKMIRYIRIYLDIAPDAFEQMGQHVVDQDWEHLGFVQDLDAFHGDLNFTRVKIGVERTFHACPNFASYLQYPRDLPALQNL